MRKLNCQTCIKKKKKKLQDTDATRGTGNEYQQSPR